MPGPSPSPLPTPSLDEQLEAFRRRRFLAMPLAGALAWSGIGVAGLVLPPVGQVWALFLGTGSIVYLGMALSRFTGEGLMDRSRTRNTFDTLFLLGTLQAILVFSLAIPFLQADHTSLPLSVGILTGLMWVPLTWLLGHWVGLFHGVGRTLLLVAAWYLVPDARFVVLPAVIVAVYVVSILVLEHRWRGMQAT